MTHRCGLYRASVANVNTSTLAVRVLCADLYGQGRSGWIPAAVPAAAVVIPTPGDEVWLSFEKGDDNYPIWVGLVANSVRQIPIEPSHGLPSVLDLGIKGDGSDETASLQALINSYPVLWFPKPPVKYGIENEPLIIPAAGVTLLGPGHNMNGITQLTPGVDAIDATSCTALTISNLRITGPGQTPGAGGVGINIGTNGTTPNSYIRLDRVRVRLFGSHGVSTASALVTKLDQVICDSNGGVGFNIAGTSGLVGTSTSLDTCYAINNTGDNYSLSYLHYSTLNNCASDSAGGNGYTLTNCEAVTATNCGAESMTDNGFKVSGGHVRLDGCWTTACPKVSFLVTSDGYLHLTDPHENAPAAGATAAIECDTGSTLYLDGEPQVVNGTTGGGTIHTVTTS